MVSEGRSVSCYILSMLERKIPNNPLKFIAYVSRPHLIFAVGAILAATIAQLNQAFYPYIMMRMVDAFAAPTVVGMQIEEFSRWAVWLFVANAAGFLFWRISGFIGMEWITRSMQTSNITLYNYIRGHSHSFFSNNFAGALSNKISNASGGVDDMLEKILWGWYPEIIKLVASIALLLLVDLYITIGFVIAFVVVLGVNWALVKRRRPHVVAFSSVQSKFRGEGVDWLTNISASRQYVRNSYEIDRLTNTANDWRTKNIFQWRWSEWIISINNIFVLLMIGSALFYTLYLLENGLTTAGAVILVVNVLGRMTEAIVFVGSMMNGFIRLYGEIEEGLGIVLTEHEIKDVPDAKLLEVKTGKIEWNDVTFEYGKNKVFDGFDLTIPSGQRVGLVGPSGAGKTTFVSLLLRQHDLNSGEILIDGQNIAEVTQDSLRENIAIVPQEPLLFHRSIRENIAYGKPNATDNEIMAVARLAQAHDFIKDLPEGYATLVGERGVKLSGGQKQRVAIARAMLKDAPILVLDEATSALDSESEVAIQKALHKLMEGKTVIAVAHRLSTLREMDRIIVLEGGKVVEDGSHDSLLAYKGVYARLWEHQAGGFLQE